MAGRTEGGKHRDVGHQGLDETQPGIPHGLEGLGGEPLVATVDPHAVCTLQVLSVCLPVICIASIAVSGAFHRLHYHLGSQHGSSTWLLDTLAKELCYQEL